MTRILIDLDDTTLNWGAEYDAQLDAYGAAADSIPRSFEHTAFDLFAGRTADECSIIQQIMAAPNYYANLRPIHGALDAIIDMELAGHEVFFVTSPWLENPTCASDKLKSVAQHFGPWRAPHTIITSDKTLIDGDVLIDDKGCITGIQKPRWKQILFTQPHNMSVTDLVRLDRWRDWRAALEGALA